MYTLKIKTKRMDDQMCRHKNDKMDEAFGQQTKFIYSTMNYIFPV